MNHVWVHALRAARFWSRHDRCRYRVYGERLPEGGWVYIYTPTLRDARVGERV